MRIELKNLENECQNLFNILNREKMYILLNKLKGKKFNEIIKLEINPPILIKSEEKLMSVILFSSEENIHYSFICKNTDNFSIIESLLYKRYPECEYPKKIFIVNGREINITLNLDDNKIRNGDIITLKKK